MRELANEDDDNSLITGMTFLAVLKNLRFNKSYFPNGLATTRDSPIITINGIKLKPYPYKPSKQSPRKKRSG